jgi:hypothetical protein
MPYHVSVQWHILLDCGTQRVEQAAVSGDVREALEIRSVADPVKKLPDELTVPVLNLLVPGDAKAKGRDHHQR